MLLQLILEMEKTLNRVREEFSRIRSLNDFSDYTNGKLDSLKWVEVELNIILIKLKKELEYEQRRRGESGEKGNDLPMGEWNTLCGPMVDV